jgi:xyloglucan-specific exo-beta-1,4-glucanase
MKKRISSLVVLAASCVGALWSPYAAAESPQPPAVGYAWRNAAIVGGGFVSGLVFHPNEPGLLYARTDMGGAYRRDPATRRWIPITDFMTNYQELGIESIALDPTDPDRVYMASGSSSASWAPNGEFLRSEDRGTTWEKFPLPFKCAANGSGRSIVERIAVDPAQPKRLYFASRAAGLFRSDDAGATWNAVAGFDVEIGGRPAPLGIVVLDPRDTPPGTPTQTLYVTTTTQRTAQSLYRSKDAGETWEAVPGQPAGWVPHQMKFAADKRTLVITYGDADGPNGIGDGAVWKLDTDSGTWTEITPVDPATPTEPGFGYSGLGLHPTDPQIMVVSSLCRWAKKDDVWMTRDGGASWMPIFHGAPLDQSIAPYTYRAHWIGDVEINPHAPSELLFTGGNGIFGTDTLDNTREGRMPSYFIAADGIEETAVLDLISPPKGAPLLSAMRDVGGFRHDDLNVSPPQGMYLNPKSGQVNALDFAQSRPELIVRANAGKPSLARSEDGGTTWTPMAEPRPEGSSASSVAISADGRAIVALPAKASAFVSRDEGATWTRSEGLPDAGVRQVLADRRRASQFFALSIENNGEQGKHMVVYRSDDYGATFAPAGTIPGINASFRAQMSPDKAGELWLPLAHHGLWKSDDAGRSFTRLENYIRGDAVGFGKAAPGASRSTIYAAGTIGDWYGLFRSTDNGATWVQINDKHHRYGNLCFAVIGDPRQFGRVYVATNGRGIIIGEPKGR